MAADGALGPYPVLALATVLVASTAALIVRTILRRRDLGTPAERATFTPLHTASLAAPHLREGLTPTGARRAVRHLRALLGARAVALVTADATLAWDGAGAAVHGSHAPGDAAGGPRPRRRAGVHRGGVARPPQAGPDPGG